VPYIVVVGGGPSGLLTTLHCLENCKFLCDVVVWGLNL
jgi:NADPH-dependent 2,4-dienoyl-CoA reductase/sulfur reductase-like enzyme